ncbi:MAG: Palmitoyltransferase [Vezdaea acicularis]|nr:MAG: Palmitoyltransferase [Vezdaea acicularis]
MDHHCPWTYNCVSYTTLPHFIRFLVYTNVSLAYLTYLLFPHLHDLWLNRALPSYLGPNVLQLVHLMSLLITLTPTFIVLLILLVRTIWNLVLNQTTIENWEIERHATLARRARFNNGFVDGPNGMRVRLKRYEFPYDIGIYKNIAEGIGSRNPLIWLWPFASTVSVKSGYDFEVNGFEDSDFAWPPPDPDRMSRKPMNGDVRDPFTHGEEGEGAESWVQAVRKRQMDDQKRFGGAEEDNYESESDMADDEVKSDHRPGQVEHIGGEEVLVWRNDDGERLADFGIDEEAEWREEDVPLGELIRRRKAHEIE